MAKSLKILLPLLLLSFIFMGSAHKFYVSVTHFNYDEEEKAFQVTSRIFIDDLESVLNSRYEVDLQLATDEEAVDADSYIGKYLNSKISVEINGRAAEITFLGKEYRNDIVLCYMEITGVDAGEIQSIAVENNVLTEVFEEQQNVVHIRIGSKKKSFILVRENNKAMLNL